MRKFLIVFFATVISVSGYAQTYNNEWINYSNTYYKFNVGATGLYRIPQGALDNAGLGSTPAENFQLWHNGVEVPLYTSVPSGILNDTDYIEFYGVMNDGSADTKLYKYDSLQMSNHWSLYTDTAAYFLTVNTSSANQRLVNKLNNVAGNTLAPEPYFMNQVSNFFKDMLNQGYGIDLGDVIHSSSYETAEGWSSGNVEGTYGSFFYQNNNLNVYPSGPTATLDAVVAGNTSAIRDVTFFMNGQTMATATVNGYNINRFHIPGVALSSFTGDAATLQFFDGGTSDDNIVLASYQVTYPSKYNFNGQSQFSFQVPASDSGNYLVITNFNSGNGIPVLYDFTNNIRLTATVSSDTLEFALPPSASARQLLLSSTDPGKIHQVFYFTQRNFVDYSSPVNQGVYLIISNPLLYNDGSGNNNVEKYREYRSTAAGGSYNAKTIDIGQLTDQFAFGIKHHPSSIKNFAAFALAKFSIQPKFLFLIGKGLDYEEFRSHESDPNVNGLALVPTFGWPGSDNLLSSTRTGEYATIPLGRLSAISGAEIGNYLTKVEQFEQAQVTDSQTINGKSWMKNMAHLIGGFSDLGLATLITSYMQGYRGIAADTLFGANVYSFSENSGVNTASGTSETLSSLFSSGLSLITYFGHSSPNTIEFNLNDPSNYNNTGKYPAIIINGCQAGDLYEFDTLRTVNGGSLSEKFTFANQKGSIAFISSSGFGLPTELNYINTGFYSNLCRNMYGQPIGNIMASTMQSVIGIYFSDYIAQSHVEEVNLHGDPAVRLNPQSAPDYAIDDSLVTISPSALSVADNKATITVRILNIGKAISDSLPVLVQHTFPNGTVETLFNSKIKPVTFEDSIVLTLPINPLIDSGVNQLFVSIDPNNTIPELSKTNNTLTKTFNIIANEIKPVWPYKYAIVNDPNVILYGSTANALAKNIQYVMQMDTTALFNSASLITRVVNDSGGAVPFHPGITLRDSTVYYWRVAVGPVTNNTNWLSSSFVYIGGADEGYNQSHYFQYTDDAFTTMNIDSTRRFNFNNQPRDLLIRTGLYPYYNWDQINVNIDANIIEQYGCKYNSLQILVYDPLTLLPWKNFNNASNTAGSYGSYPICGANAGGYRYIFEFPYDDSNYRKNAIAFLNSIPNGDYVSITNLGWIYNTVFVNQWKADSVNLGSGNTLWDEFHKLGLNHIDSFTTNLPFLFLFKKGDSVNFPIYQSIGPSPTTQIVNTYTITGKQVQGAVQTPLLGLAKTWRHFKWDELASGSLQTTQRKFSILGQDSIGNVDTLATIYNAKDTDVSFISGAVYPSLSLLMYNNDSLHAEATQLKYWMLTGDKAPEGAVSPNILFQAMDTLTIHDTLHLRVAFKNVSDVPFDSIKTRLTITDANGINHIFTNLQNGNKLRPVAANDTVIIYYDIPMISFVGNNQLMLEVNPDNDQPEQFHFNNFLYYLVDVLGPLCPGDDGSFTAGPTLVGRSYQWQVDSGNGYTPIAVNGSVYSGITSSTLVLDSPSTSMYGYKFRCAITQGLVTTYSGEFTLQFADYWIGGADTAWENTANWSCGVLPDINTDVFIKGGSSNYPVINSSAFCRSLMASPATSVKVNLGFSLFISGPPK